MVDRWQGLAVRERLWVCVSAAALICAILSFATGFRLHPRSYGLMAVAVFVMVVSPFVRPHRFGRMKAVAEAADALLMFTVVGMVGAVASYVAMVHSGAMMDGMLDRIDALMGFRWPAIRSTVDAYPLVLMVLEQAYFLCFPMPVFIMAVLAGTGQSKRIYDFLTAYGSSLAVTIAVAFFFPAKAAFEFYHCKNVPGNGQHFGAIIKGLRSGTLREIDIGDLGGIVTFPSFHASMAVLFIWAIWPIKALRLPMLVLNGLMWAAAAPIGGHYVIDVWGGSLIALISIVAVQSPKRAVIDKAGNHPAAIAL